MASNGHAHTGNGSDGAKIELPTSLPANGGHADTADKLTTPRKINGVNFDGSADIQVYSGVQGSFKNLKIQVTSNTQAIVTIDQIILFDSSSNAKLVSSVSSTLDKTILSAVNGLDTGVIANSTWYYVFTIAKVDGTKGVLMSLSSTAPTLPNGYTFKARIGAIKTHTDGTLLRTLQYGRKVQYVVTSATNTPNMPLMTSGSQGNLNTPTWIAVNVLTFVPPTSVSIDVVLSITDGGAGSNQIIIAPNNSYGARTSATNPPPLVNMPYAAASNMVVSKIISLESTNIYCAASATAYCFCAGWEDNL